VSYFSNYLKQVAPTGTPPINVQQSAHINDSGISARIYQSPLSNSSRRNFSTHDVNRPPELSEESLTQQADSCTQDETSANIYNIDEYNKIFKPRKELERPTIREKPKINNATSKGKSSISSPPREPTKSIDAQPSLVLKLQTEMSSEKNFNSPLQQSAVYKSQQQLQQQQPNVSVNPPSLPTHDNQSTNSFPQVHQSIPDYPVKFYEAPAPSKVMQAKEPSIPDYKDFIPVRNFKITSSFY
jgi:hypothetical protein